MEKRNTFTEYSDLVKYKAEIRTLEILKILKEGDTPEDIRKCLKKHLGYLYNEIEKLEEDVRNLKRQIR